MRLMWLAESTRPQVDSALYSIDPEWYRDSLQQAVNNLGIKLRDLGRSEEEITNELDRLLSTDDE
jgi:hypothetical protein